jgi:EmrB/QacA subfamily drug resistance transporter
MQLPRIRYEYKHIVAVVFTLGLFMDLLDVTIVNVALPTIGREYHAGAGSIEWTITGYLLALAAAIPVSGWAGDRFGTKPTFIFALAVFTTSSLLCGLSWDTTSLVGFRVLQGIGGGLLTPVGTTMVLRAFPMSERASVTALLTVPAVLGPALGPVVGGYLVEYQSWRWIFFINIPIGLLALAIAVALLHEPRPEGRRRLDVAGLLLAAPGLSAVVFALSQAGPHGLGDVRVVVAGGAGLIALAVFVAVELRTKEPLIDLRQFGEPMFRLANLVQFFSYARFQGSIFLFALFLQTQHGLSPFQAGLTSFPSALGVMSMMPLAGRAYRRFGPRRVMVIAYTASAAASAVMLLASAETSQWWLRLAQLGWGASFGFSIVALQTATFANIAPAAMGRASAAYNSIRQVGGSFGVALLATVLSSRLGAENATLTSSGGIDAFHAAWLVAAVLALTSAALSLLVNDRLAANTFNARAVAPVDGRVVEEVAA